MGALRGLRLALTSSQRACQGSRVSCIDFHRTEDLLVSAAEDESIRLYNTATATLVKTVHSKKYGVDLISFTHHPSAVIYTSRNGWDGAHTPRRARVALQYLNISSAKEGCRELKLRAAESLRYLSLHDNRYLRYFKGHRDKVVSLCMSPKNDTFMSGSLDHTVRLWDLRNSACQGLVRVRGRPAVTYDQQGLVFAIAMEGGTVKLFDTKSYDKASETSSHQGPFDTFTVGGDKAEVSCMKFSNDGKLLLVSTTNNRIYVLDAYAGNQLHSFTVLQDLDGACLEASFSPDGRYLLSGSGDKSLHAWSTASGQEVACWGALAGVPSVIKWAPRRLMFASASSALSFWIPDLTKLQL
eukprot:SM000003S10967  [mRNA]  locus=s3:14867:17145:+ [translate_table: standard]